MQLVFSIARERMADAPLMKLGDLVQWSGVEQHMQADYWRAAFRKGGRVPYDHRAMFRALLIARWYCLTFPALEHALRVRLDFLIFCGFDGNAKLPDASTLSRFRSRLVESGKLAAMFEEVDSQLNAQGLMLSTARSAVVDCKIISSKNLRGATLGATGKARMQETQ